MSCQRDWAARWTPASLGGSPQTGKLIMCCSSSVQCSIRGLPAVLCSMAGFSSWRRRAFWTPRSKKPGVKVRCRRWLLWSLLGISGSSLIQSAKCLIAAARWRVIGPLGDQRFICRSLPIKETTTGGRLFCRFAPSRCQPSVKDRMTVLPTGLATFRFQLDG